jgi:signal transduction histidine kinase
MEQPGGEPAFEATVRDLTEGKRRADELRAALEISRAILGGQPDDAVLQLVARRARALVEGDCALVRTLGAGGNVLVLRASAWRRPKDAVRTRPAHELPREASIAGRVFDSGRPRLVADLAAVTRAPSRARELARPCGGPALFVPLNAGSRVLGTLTVQKWKSGRPFQRQDLNVLRRFASQAALALHHANVNHDRDRRAVAEERERLGRELHDGAIQSLYAVTLGLAEVGSRTTDRRFQKQLESLGGRIDGVVQGLRSHIHRLRRDLAPGSQDDATGAGPW